MRLKKLASIIAVSTMVLSLVPAHTVVASAQEKENAQYVIIDGTVTNI